MPGAPAQFVGYRLFHETLLFEYVFVLRNEIKKISQEALPLSWGGGGVDCGREGQLVRRYQRRYGEILKGMIFCVFFQKVWGQLFSWRIFGAAMHAGGVRSSG